MGPGAWLAALVIAAMVGWGRAVNVEVIVSSGQPRREKLGSQARASVAPAPPPPPHGLRVRINNLSAPLVTLKYRPPRHRTPPRRSLGSRALVPAVLSPRESPAVPSETLTTPECRSECRLPPRKCKAPAMSRRTWITIPPSYIFAVGIPLASSADLWSACPGATPAPSCRATALAPLTRHPRQRQRGAEFARIVYVSVCGAGAVVPAPASEGNGCGLHGKPPSGKASPRSACRCRSLRPARYRPSP